MTRAEQPAELLLELLDVGALNELSAFAAFANQLREFGNDPRAEPANCGHRLSLFLSVEGALRSREHSSPTPESMTAQAYQM